jgi:hypothetical protein
MHSASAGEDPERGEDREDGKGRHVLTEQAYGKGWICSGLSSRG